MYQCRNGVNKHFIVLVYTFKDVGPINSTPDKKCGKEMETTQKHRAKKINCQKKKIPDCGGPTN